MPRYIKCPRCELNYIEEDKELCEVCLAEKQGRHLRFADEIDEIDIDDSEKTKICPICGEQYIYPTEKCCEDCKDKNLLAEDDLEPDVEQEDDEWRKYLDEDIRELELEEELQEELDESIDEEFEDELLEEDIKDYDDDINDLDDDYDDEEDEEEDFDEESW